MLGNDILYRGKKVVYAGRVYQIDVISGLDLKLRSVNDTCLVVGCKITSPLLKNYTTEDL